MASIRFEWVSMMVLAVCTIGIADEAEIFNESPVVADGASLRLLADGCTFTEGPSADREGNVYFTDQPNDRILLYTIAGKLSTWLQPCGRSNGLFVNRKGEAILACADEKNELWSIDIETRSHRVLVAAYNGKLLNGPNDVWEAPGGGIYFTDPFYKRGYWSRGPSEQDTQGVYYLPVGGGGARRVIDDMEQPNGIVGSSDGRSLYVADIRAGKTYRYRIETDGTLAGRTLAASLGSDGMTLDTDGNLYLTGKGVTVFDRNARQIEHIHVPQGWTANVCFGGADGKTLFITAKTSLYGLTMRVRGDR